MREGLAHVKNVQNLLEVWEALSRRHHDTPGVGVLWALTGAGKTTAAAWLAVQKNAVFVRALAVWSPSSMLGDIARELDLPLGGSCAQMVVAISARLRETGRSLFIDEADYIVDNKRLIETLRDLHDVSGAPLILIGMKDFKKKLSNRAQFAGRVARWVEFGAADIDDARLLVDKKCEAGVDDDLLDLAVQRLHGSMRGLTGWLPKVEELAKKLGKTTLTLKDWGKRPFSFVDAADDSDDK